MREINSSNSSKQFQTVPGTVPKGKRTVPPDRVGAVGAPLPGTVSFARRGTDEPISNGSRGVDNESAAIVKRTASRPPRFEAGGTNGFQT